MKKSVLIVLLVLISSSTPGSSLRCKGLVVKEGDSINVLLRKCGSPLNKYSSKEVINAGGQRQLTRVSNWAYARKGKRLMVVSVRNGTVVKMQVE